MSETIGLVFIITGLAFDFLGCLGLVRLPDLYNRLQASTKCVTFGTCGIMLGIFIMNGFTGMGIKALLCAVFLLLTAPVSAHAIARAAHIAGFKLWEKSVCDKYQEDKGKG
ncbi:MAG: Na+/H+ antiporter subunit G [Elusimicrobia bacterium CG_4_10_14_0_8_um_filter_37_32]|nr:MAG: Na+/H+ antiporter subunit G [Elusimicrobia bacterium CG02_land_8_20_14_3_00_37_13]PIZ13388.1 MAG: Na+/H+ antiporter subunit G [Elusimicrobia bacterium CG_4_10_14_0_8_um_filter_37_32]